MKTGRAPRRAAWIGMLTLAVAAGVSAQKKPATGSPPAAKPPAVKSSKTPAVQAKTSTGRKAAASRRASTARRRTVARGQTAPDAARSREIQEALLKAGYLKGEPSGKWDKTTSDALARYQKENGFQVTGKPDAKSLTKLGLGPKHENQIPAPNL